MSGQFLQIRSVVKSFGPVVAVDDVSLDVEEGEIVCLLGPSGCGKTTLLRLVAGLETPNAGAVRFDLRDVTSMPIHQRGFGMMFQSFALFPHFSVFENVAYGLKMQKLEKGEIRSRVREMLDLVSMHGYESRSIDELSGGQQQRVALARALATQPRLLMLDEPLGALDRALRERLMLELRDIIKSVGVTAIYVTHDQSEAYAVADKIAIMDAGKLQQYAAPSIVFRSPASRFVAQFIGFENIITGYRLGSDLVETPIGALRCQAPVPGEDGEQVDLLIRPNSLTLAPTPNSIRATHVSTVFRGRFSDVTLRVGQTDLVFEVEEPESVLSALAGTIYLNPKAIQVIGA